MRFTVLEDDMIKRASYVFCNSKIALRGRTVNGVQQFVAYQLTSFISHTDTHKNDHYFFLGLDSDTGRVVLCGDTQVSEKNLFEDQHAYLLAYQKLN